MEPLSKPSVPLQICRDQGWRLLEGPRAGPTPGRLPTRLAGEHYDANLDDGMGQ